MKLVTLSSLALHVYLLITKMFSVVQKSLLNPAWPLALTACRSAHDANTDSDPLSPLRVGIVTKNVEKKPLAETVLLWWPLLSPQQKRNLSTALMSFQYEYSVAGLIILEALINEGQAQTEEIKATLDKQSKAEQIDIAEFSGCRADRVGGWRFALALPAGGDPIQRNQAACYGPEKSSRNMQIVRPRTRFVCCRYHTWNLKIILQDTCRTTNQIATST